MTVYEGDEDFIFISYSHKDSNRVLPVITTLQSHGFRVWYDPGIEPGSEWPEYIAEHINNCRVFFSFMSQNAASSQNCRQEIYQAGRKDKDILVVYLEDTVLTAGMEMKLGPLQAIKRKTFNSDVQFIDALCNVQMIQSCMVAQQSTIHHLEESQNFLIDREVLARFVDTIFGASIAASQLPPDAMFSIDNERNRAIQALDEAIGLAIFSQFTKAQNEQFNVLLDSENATENDFERFFHSTGIDLDYTISETMKKFGIDYAKKLAHLDLHQTSSSKLESASQTTSKQQVYIKDENDPYANVGRNDPCPCGSGKKFKKCHGAYIDR